MTRPGIRPVPVGSEVQQLGSERRPETRKAPTAVLEQGPEPCCYRLAGRTHDVVEDRPGITAGWSEHPGDSSWRSWMTTEPPGHRGDEEREQVVSLLEDERSPYAAVLIDLAAQDGQDLPLRQGVSLPTAVPRAPVPRDALPLGTVHAVDRHQVQQRCHGADRLHDVSTSAARTPSTN